MTLLLAVLQAAAPARFEETSGVPPPGMSLPYDGRAAIYDVYDNYWGLWPAGSAGNKKLMVRRAQSPHDWVTDTWSGIEPGPWRFLQADEYGYLWIASSKQLRRMDPRFPARGWTDATRLLEHGEITAMGIAPSGSTLVALKSGTVAEIDLGDGSPASPTAIFAPSPAAVTRLVTDSDGRVWAAAGGKTYRRDAPDDAWQHRWELAARLPGGNHDLSGDVWNGKFYMAGGQTANWGYPATHHVFDQVFEFDVRSLKWKIAGKLSHPRFYNGTTFLGGRIWIIAGNVKNDAGKTQDLATVEVCDPATGAVKPGPSLPMTMEMPLAVHIGGRIYVSGARLGAAPESPLKLYSIGSGESAWRAEPDGPAAPKSLAGVAKGDKFYVVVPRLGLVSFDPASRKWQPIDSPEHPRSCQVAAYRGEIWLMGGRDVPAGDHVWIYNPHSGEWRRGPDLPRELSWGTAAEVNGRLMLTGGAAGRCYNNRTFLLRDQ